MGNFSGIVIAAIGSLVGLAVVSVIFGSRNTSSVIGTSGAALANVIAAAVAPVTGSAGTQYGSGSFNPAAFGGNNT